MPPVQQDVIIQQGATFAQLWELQNKDLTAGYSFAAKFRSSHTATTAVLTITSFTVAKVGSHTHVTSNVAAATTAALGAPANGVYDLESTQTSTGIVTREAEGSYYITPEATK